MIAPEPSPDNADEFFTRFNMPTDAVGEGDVHARSVPGFSYRSRDQHAALGVTWGYPFDHRGYTTALVDGYDTPTYGGHKGVDYFSSPQIGSTIYAVADGVVSTAQQTDMSDLGAHVVVRLDSGGIYVQYGHMSAGSLMVSSGTRVSRGTPLGKTGWTGYVVPKAPSAAHLHLAIRSEPNVLWNPLWLVHNAPLPGTSTPPPTIIKDDMTAVLYRAEGHSPILALGSKFWVISESEAQSAVSGGVPSVWLVARTLKELIIDARRSKSSPVGAVLVRRPSNVVYIAHGGAVALQNTEELNNLKRALGIGEVSVSTSTSNQMIADMRNGTNG